MRCVCMCVHVLCVCVVCVWGCVCLQVNVRILNCISRIDSSGIITALVPDDVDQIQVPTGLDTLNTTLSFVAT